jgi:histidinol dehydrogenase
VPVSTVGACLPAGRVPLLASPVMTVLVPKVAGVETVIACAPPQRGASIFPSLVYSAALSGADRIFALGGVQALAAMAFGLGGIEPATAEVAGAAWRDHGAIIVTRDRETAARVSDELAAEHLEVQTGDDDWYHARLRDYGSIFLGARATVAFSDKGSTGTNHVLPTGHAARYTGGLSVARFLKPLTYQRIDHEAASVEIAEAVAAISAIEGLAGHGATATKRLARIGSTP